MFGPSKRELLRIIEQERKQHRAEIAALLDRLAALAGKPWTPPPADLPREPWEPALEPRPLPLADPEQLPKL